MNNDFLTAVGYLDLGMADQARREFLKVRPDEAEYACARSELMMLSGHLDVVAMSYAAEEGLNLIRSRPEIVHSALVNNTALCLHYAGRSREARDLTYEFADILEWTPGDFYGLACYAARIGDFEQAAWNLVEGMVNRLSPDYSHMLIDIDLEYLFRHAAEEGMDIETAVCLANPRLTAALEVLGNGEDGFDGMLVGEMPPRFQKNARWNPNGGHYSFDPKANETLRREFQAWLWGVKDRITILIRRGIARAREMVFDAQFGFAVAAAKRGDFLAARYHSIFGFSARPETFDRFDSALSQLGMRYFFNDIRHAWREDSVFRELIRSTTPFETKSPPEQIENLDDCGPLTKETTFWILLRSVQARSIDGPAEAKFWHIEVIRRWPDDPSAFYNLLLIYENEKDWDKAALLLAGAPLSFHHLRAAESHADMISRRMIGGLPQYRHFYGQPDIGRIVVLPSERVLLQPAFERERR